MPLLYFYFFASLDLSFGFGVIVDFEVIVAAPGVGFETAAEELAVKTVTGAPKATASGTAKPKEGSTNAKK